MNNIGSFNTDHTHMQNKKWGFKFDWCRIAGNASQDGYKNLVYKFFDISLTFRDF